MRRALVLVGIVLVAACGGSGDAGLTPQAVTDGLKAAGFTLDELVIQTEETDPNELLGRPGQYVGKANWATGTVETFDSGSDMDRRWEYLDAGSDMPVFGGWYQYRHGNAILRVDYEVTPSDAERIKVAFEAL